MATKYTKIVNKTYLSMLLEFICVTHFNAPCTDWDKVTVKFVARSDDILIYALQTWEHLSSLCTRWRKFASHAQLTFAPLYDKASVAKEWSHLIVMYSHETNISSFWNWIALRSLSRVVYRLRYSIMLCIVERKKTLDRWVFVLDHRVLGLRSSFLVFVLNTSY